MRHINEDQPYTPPSWQYQGAELKTSSAMRAFTLPSRMGDLLHYPDGRVLPFPSEST